MLKYTIDDAKILAQSHDGYFLSSKYMGSNIKHRWRCHNNHEWDATFDHVNRGVWCPFCSGKAKHTIEDCKILAFENNGYFLSSQYINSRTKYKWGCCKGHEFYMSFESIQDGHWCKCCGRNATKNKINDCYKLAAKQDGYFLDSEYLGAHFYYRWQCNNGHIWTATYNKIQQNRWCPECSIKKDQKQLQLILEDLLNEKASINYRKFVWLTNERRLEIDLWFPILKLAIEFDGRQHLEAITFFGGQSGFEKQNKRDGLKDKLIKYHPEEINHFIRFNCKEDITEFLVIKKLKMAGIKLL